MNPRTIQAMLDIIEAWLHITNAEVITRGNYTLSFIAKNRHCLISIFDKIHYGGGLAHDTLPMPDCQDPDFDPMEYFKPIGKALEILRK